MMHTSQLDTYATHAGKRVQIWKRPAKTRQKEYREPKLAESKSYRTTRLAREAAEAFNATQH